MTSVRTPKPTKADRIVAIAAVVLNAYFNRTTQEEASEDAVLAAQGASHI